MTITGCSFAVQLAILAPIVVLSACNLVGSGTGQPPLPTIVPVTSTASPTIAQVAANSLRPAVETALPALEATSQPQLGDVISIDENQDDRLNQNVDPPTPVNRHLEAATPTSTAVATPTDVPPTASPVGRPTATSVPSLDALQLKFTTVAAGFTKPVYLTHAGDGTGRLFVVEQEGRIRIIKAGSVNPTPFLDISSVVGSDGLEQGLLSVAFHPDFASNGFFFVNYTDRQGHTVVGRYTVTEDLDIADSNSEKLLVRIEQPYANHNGGQIAFGPDGYLYIGMGDGGAANDPQNRAQSLDTLLGKILRLDVDQGEPYGVPATNPFVGTDQARPEIWSYGWRNPWRFSFDRATNDLYVGDVGQNQYEEIHVEWAGTAGQNYGWRLMEGFHCFNPSECDPVSSNLKLPVAEYDHRSGCSVTGGYVYRGTQFPALEGTYLYGDYCSGIVWGLRYEGEGRWSNEQLTQTEAVISSFGQDEAGNVYLLDYEGSILLVGI
jgi:glucose/arabinose dehydrogenase